MKRFAIRFSVCSVFLLSVSAAHGAPAARKRTAASKKAKAKKVRKAKRARTAKTPIAKGPGVSKRNGVPRLGPVPQGTVFDPAFERRFGPMETKSNPSGGTLRKRRGTPRLQLTGVATLTPDKPSSGGMFLAGYGVRWRAGAASWMEPEISVLEEGSAFILMPLGPNVAGQDLMVECEGDFEETMTVRGGVVHSHGYFTTSAADFSFVSDSLKFMISVPTTSEANPAFRIGIAATGDERWTLRSCEVERI